MRQLPPIGYYQLVTHPQAIAQATCDAQAVRHDIDDVELWWVARQLLIQSLG